MVELSSLLKLPQWTSGDSTSIENALENVKTGLAEVGSHLISSRMSTLSNEDLISNVSSGSALRGLVVGLMPSTAQVIKQAVSPLVMKPDFCTITLGSMANKMKTFTFKSQNSATDFQKTIDSTGANYGVQLQASGWGFAVEGDLKHRNHSKNEEKTDGETTSNTLISLKCYQFPMSSFQLDRNNLTFRTDAINKLREINDYRSAEEFMQRYGSHFPTGHFQLGGILWHKLQVNTDKSVLIRDLEELSTKELDASASIGFKSFFKASGSMKTTSMKSRVASSSETSATATIQFESEALGPAVFNPVLFEQILRANSDTWHIIDRGDLDSLVPIWEIVYDLHPELSDQCELMRKAWLGQTSSIPRVKFIEQERERIQQRVCKQIKNNREKELRLKLALLYQQELAVVDESNLLNQIKLIVDDINILCYNKSPSAANPWVDFFAKEEQLCGILKRLVSDQQLIEKFPRVLDYIRHMLSDDVLQVMDHAGFPLDQSIVSHLKVQSNVQPVIDEEWKIRATANTFLEQALKMAHQDSKPHDEKVQQIQNSLVNFFSTFDDDIDNINQHNQIENVLINKYGWKNSSFSTGITVDGVLALVRDIEYIRNNGKIMTNEDDHHQQQNDSNRGTGELDDETYMSVDEEDLQTCEVILFNLTQLLIIWTYF